VPARLLELKHAFRYPRLRGAREHLTHPAPASARNAMQARHA